MKKYILAIVAALVAFTFVSCDQSRLDIPQKGVLAEDTFYQTDEDCLEALAAVYAGIYHSPQSKFYTYLYTVMGQVSDELYTADQGYAVNDSHAFMFYTYDSANKYITSPYKALFIIVYRCNLVIEKFADGQSAIMKNAVAEAKVIRSWAYTYLISLFGRPPIIDHVLKTNDEYRQPNAETADLWKWTIETLDEAIASGALESKSSVNDKSKVRVTKEFAIALKGKAQVYTGDYAGAKATLEQVINSGKYELIPGDQLKDLFFTSKGNHSSESIFETNVIMDENNYKDVKTSDQWAAYNLPRDLMQVEPGSELSRYSARWNHYTPTDKFLRAIVANEGIHSNRFEAWFFSYEDMQDWGLKELSTARTEANAKFLASSTMEKPSVDCPYKVSIDYNAECHGFWQRKMTVLADDIVKDAYESDKVNRRYFRYAEVLLLYAEACAQLGETGGKGLEALNSIAERAGAPTYSTLTLDNVKKEKWFEMWGEMTRFFDLVRWGDAERELADHNNTLPVFFGYKPGKTGADLNEKGTNFDQVYEIRYFDVATFNKTKYSFTKGKDELFPFPNTEIANNPELQQNPGW